MIDLISICKRLASDKKAHNYELKCHQFYTFLIIYVLIKFEYSVIHMLPILGKAS
jgi:hypothetical protein